MVDVLGWLGGAASAVGSYVSPPQSNQQMSAESQAVLGIEPVTTQPQQDEPIQQIQLPQAQPQITSTDTFVEKYVNSNAGDNYSNQLHSKDGFVVGDYEGAPTKPGWYNAGPWTEPTRGYGIGGGFVEAGKNTSIKFFPLGDVVSSDRKLSDSEQQKVLSNLTKSGIKGGWWDTDSTKLVKDVNFKGANVEAGKNTSIKFFPLGDVVSSDRKLSDSEQQKVLSNLTKSGIKGGWWDTDSTKLVKDVNFKGANVVSTSIEPSIKEITKPSDKTISIELESGDIVQRKSSDYNLGFLGGFINKEETLKPTITGNVKSQGITKETINQYLLPEDMVSNKGSNGSDKAVTSNMIKTTEQVSSGIVDTNTLSRGVNVSATRSSPVKSVIDTKLYETGIETPEVNVGGMKIGGRLGSGESMSGLTMKSMGIPPLYRPPGMGPLTLYRKSKKSKSVIHRKPVYIRKPTQKILNLESLEKQVLPNTLGKGLFKFNIGTPDVLAKSLGARVNVKVKSNINEMSKKIKIPDIEMRGIKKNSDVSGNINTILAGIVKSSKK